MRNALLSVGLLVSADAVGMPLVVTELMYDPTSNEDRWEWIEVFNAGAEPLDLDGFFVDRIGDRALAAEPTPQIRSSFFMENLPITNSTVVPSGGVAVLYNGSALGFDPERFRAAWPTMPSSAVLVGLEGWASNQLNNTPAASDLAPELPGRTFGFWSDEAAYRSDTLNLGSSDAPDFRVAGVDAATFSFSYDDAEPWPMNNNAASIRLDGVDALDGNSWRRSVVGVAGATISMPTALPGAAINGPDFGSPGIAPGGEASGLKITELMYDPASINGSTEWEWIEVYNGGPGALDFATTPHWLDDDDGSLRDRPNVDEGVIPAGGVAILFNAAAASTDDFQAAWASDSAPNTVFIAVENWPALANGGDVVGLWAEPAAYAADHAAGGTVAGAAAGVVYDDGGDWPNSNNADSISLSDLAADPADPTSWVRASDLERGDPNAFKAAPLTGEGLPDNSGEDVGSPGVVDEAPQPLAGDYNADGRVDAADYTVWRDGGPLANETASLGVVDTADYEAWVAGYSAASAASVPEPSAAGVVVSGSMAALGVRRR